MKVLEVDDLKILRYGTTEQCHPLEDFPAAGRWAKHYLDKGTDVILVEPFISKSDLTLVLTSADRLLGSDAVSCVWLQCTLETALSRKARDHAEDVIRAQHDRCSHRYNVPGETTICTDSRSPTEIEDDLLKLLPPTRT
jgi:hypothetical protein